MPKLSTIALLAAPVIAALLVTPALAESKTMSGDFSFRFQEFEMQTQGGREQLLQRLERQVAAHCEVRRIAPLPVVREAKRCQARVMDMTIAQLDRAELAAQYRQSQTQLASR